MGSSLVTPDAIKQMQANGILPANPFAAPPSNLAIPGLNLNSYAGGGMSSAQAAVPNPLIRGIAAPSAPTTPAIPNSLLSLASPTQANQDTARLNYLRNSGTGISQIGENVDALGNKTDAHPGFWKELGKVGATVGDDVLRIAAPNVERLIPGGAGYHQNLVAQQEGTVADDLNQANSRAQTANLAATTRLTNDKATASETPAPEYDWHDTPNGPVLVQKGTTTASPVIENGSPIPPTPKPGKFTLHDTPDGLLRVDENTGDANYVTADGQKVGPKISTKTVQLQIGGQPHQVLINDANGTPIKDLGVSGEKPPTTNINAGTWALEEDGQGNPILLNNKTGQTKAAPGGVQKAGTHAKASAPYQAIVDEATSAHQLAAMAEAGNAPADVDLALSFFKTMRGAGGAGIRFTQAEQNLIMGARSMGGDLQGVAQKVLGGGQKFTPEQRSNILKVIDLHAQAAQQHLQGPTQPPTTSQPTPQPSSGPAHSLATAMALPFNKGKSSAQVSSDLQAHGYRVVP